MPSFKNASASILARFVVIDKRKYDKYRLMSTTTTDLNLLHALEALLVTGSVTQAAERVGITVPAMSRALGRLREQVRDPLLVRAGRGMVLTPHAVALRDRVARAREEARRLLSPASATPLVDLEGVLTLRCADAVAAWLAAPLFEAARTEVPRVRLVFRPEGEEDAAALRDGRVDLDVGALDLVEPELVQRQLFVEHYAFLVRQDHPLGLLPTAPELAAHPHVAVSRRGRVEGPVDEALASVGVQRWVGVVVGSFLAAGMAVASSDFVAAVPSSVARHLSQLLPVRVVPAPFPLPPVRIGMVWHPRSEHDPAVRWLRAQVVAMTSTWAADAA